MAFFTYERWLKRCGNSPAESKLRHRRGLTLIELAVALAIVALLLAVALPSFRAYFERADVVEATRCLQQISSLIEQRYVTVSPEYPDSLAGLGLGDCATDPWGNPFRYLKIAGKKGKGGNRKDRSENPLNSDYDLYSMGKDGKTNQSLRPKVSHDDVIRAKNGAYLGLAADY